MGNADPRFSWGPWRLNLGSAFPTLDYGSYWVKVEDLASDRDLLRWIRYVHGKIWGRDPVNLGNFVEAALTIRQHGYRTRSGQHVTL